MPRPPLPIDGALAEVLAAVTGAGALVLAAPPGSGKTTRVPGALADGGVGGEVVVLEPRRVAARAAARRVAAERGSDLGAEVGFQVRHQRRLSRRTRIRFVTEGVLARQLVGDPFLEGVGAVVLDEFHERHLEGDLVLAMLREVRETVRPELAVVVMSATLDVDTVRGYLGGCPVVEVPGTLHEVRTVHAEQRDDRPLEVRVAAAVRRALGETAGDVLVFLPGVGEIRRAAGRLEGVGAEVLPLHGRLPAAEQDRALNPGAARRVVLATNLAESSLTVPGVTAVVDAGLARRLHHDPRRGLDVLRLETISQSSADQRRGRAGRTGPGVCYRLWTRGEERGMAEREAPEVTRIDVAGALLQVAAFTGGSIERFRWFEPPAPAALERGTRLLRVLGALGPGGRLTPVGARMLAAPLAPRLARMMVEAERLGCRRAAAGLAALLSERDLLGPDAPVRPAEALELLALLDEVEHSGAGGGACRARGVDRAALRAVLAARDQIAGRGRAGHADPDALRRALLAGFGDRVARRTEPGAAEALMVGGRGLRLPPEAVAESGDLLLALQVAEVPRSRSARAAVTVYTPLERDWLDEVFPGAVVTELSAELDRGRRRVVGVRRVSFLDLVLEEARGGSTEAAEAERLLGDLVASDPWQHLPAADGLRAFLARVAWLRRTCPDLELPELGDTEVGEAARVACAGCSRLDQVRPAAVRAILEQRLGLPHGELQRRAPERLRLPSGRAAVVDYTAAAGPTVAAAVQELFGCRETPRLAGGRVAVVLSLLGPNRRPVQITRDLDSFWSTIYPRVRGELSRRYPRHDWPQDPLAAKPHTGPRRRRPS